MNTNIFQKHKALSYAAILIIAVIRAFLNEIFIYPNNFAPSGIAGIATMLQYLFGFKVGYFSLIVNIPLILLSMRALGKPFAGRTFTYIAGFSVANIIFRGMDFSGIAFYAIDAGENILAAIAAGVIGGLDFACNIRLGGSTGGTDIVSELIHNKNPEYNMVWINFTINAVVASASFFVYGRLYTPVILCIIYIFVSSRLSDLIFKGAKAAIQFEVFTDQPEELSRQIITQLRHGCTMVRAEGMYTHKELSLLICVVNRHQVVDFENIIKQYPGSFAVISSVSSTYGNFKKIK